MSVERNIKFAPTSHIAFPLLPEGEQSTHNDTQASQQGEDSPSATSDTTKVDPASWAPALSKIPTLSRLTTRSMARAANAGSSRQTTLVNTCAEVTGSPIGTQLQGEPFGESSSYITLDDKSIADFIFHATLDHEIIAAVQEAKGDPKMLHEAWSHSDWPCWKEAVDREMGTLEKAGTWNTVSRPPGKNVVGSGALGLRCAWGWVVELEGHGQM
jgi:hypothetical protein